MATFLRNKFPTPTRNSEDVLQKNLLFFYVIGVLKEVFSLIWYGRYYRMVVRMHLEERE
jgi:hypothetical protein